MARLPWHFFFGLFTFASGLAIALIGVALQLMGTYMPTLGIYLFGAAGLLTVIGLGGLLLGLWSWIKGLLRQLERAQDAAVQGYQDYTSGWILDENNPLAEAPPEDRRRSLARERTLTVLGNVGPKGKREVLRFLRNQHLLNRDSAVITPNGADLSNAYLADMDLGFIILTQVNLKGADLSGASLSTYQYSVEDLLRAREQGLDEHDFAGTTAESWLEFADLTGADLRNAKLAGCNLTAAKLKGAKLHKADLRGTDLRLTRGLTRRQIKRAYGSYAQHGLVPGDEMPDTRLPEGLEPPAAWRKPLSEQKRDRERSYRAIRRVARLLRIRN